MRDPNGGTGVAQIAVHMSVLRGNADSTHVLYWYHGFATRLMLNAMDTTLARHVDIKTGNETDQGYIENFCGGHTLLADGRIFVGGGAFGGTGDAQSGSRFAEIFDPKSYGNSTRGWTKPDSMPSNRWYPTCTTMPDGSVLVTQGDEHYQLMMYGGAANNDVAQNDLRTFATTSSSPFWKAETVQAGTQYERVGHSATYVGGETPALFGGKNAAGTYLANLQFAYRSDITDSDQRWTLYDPGALGTAPSPRWRHGAAEIIFTPPRDEFRDKAMFIFGGLDSVNQNSGGTPRNDVFELHFVEATDTWAWVQQSPSGNAPSPRFGHVTVFDRGQGFGPADSSRLLVFGGRNNDRLLDNAVYALRLGTSPPSWYVAIDSTADATAAPSKREGHVAIFDPEARPPGPTAKRQMVLFGGRDSAGVLLNDTWVLQRLYNATTYSWKKLNPAGPPAARTEAAVYYDDKRQRMVVIGGDGNGPTSGGKRDDVWGLPLAATQSSDSAWKQMPSMGGLGARAGHAVAFIPVKPVKNRIIQRFVPTASTGQQWKTLQWAPKLMPVTYPFMFVLPNGYVAWVGPNVATGCSGCFNHLTMLLNPDSTAGVSRGWQSTTWSNGGFWGGGAVMYSAGSDSVFILKAGGHYDFEGASDSTHMIAFSTSGGSGGWRRVATGSGALTARKSHNLTVLPTGEVLATGGRGGIKAKPQIWNPSTKLWSAELAEEPRMRNRHSTAVLLPDGRVLSAGGSNESAADALDDTLGTVYEPPYLFKSDSSYATRPPLNGNPQRVRYGAQFSACMSASDSIVTVCMIRAGATTHGFNQDQRYVPLTFTPANFPTSRVTVTAPADSFRAPPGDYMLFLVNTKGVPSIARWVRVGSSWSEGDMSAPAQVADFHADLVTSSSVRLVWTATGDDGTSGTASYADLKYSLAPISNDTEFAAATPASPQPVPACSGTTQSYTVSGLEACTVYYFALKFGDESGNWSPCATASAVTGGIPYGNHWICPEGGSRARIARDASLASGANRAGEAGASFGTPAIAPTAAAPTGGGTFLSVEAVPSSTGPQLKLAALGAASDPADAGGAGGLYQTPEGNDRWTTQVGYDLPEGGRFALLAPEHPGRWVFLEPVVLQAVLSTATAGGTIWRLDQAIHSRLGDVTDTLGTAGQPPTMSLGDTLTVNYAAVSANDGPPTRGWLILLDRPSTAPKSARGGPRPAEPGSALPRAFALRQNQPNPFATATTIGFDLPTGAMVRLEVFDLAGRRLKVLANRFYPPGEHEVAWHRRTTSGALVAPGLYFYRMDAGQYREKKRMVVLP